MNHADQKFLTALGGEPGEGDEWRCFSRNGRVLVIFRSTRQGVHQARALYSPQSLIARLASRILLGPFGLWQFLPSLRWGEHEEAPLAKVLKETGVKAQAILLGNPNHQGRRAIVLGDGKVIKVGVSGEAARLVIREADFLEKNGAGENGLPKLLGRFQDGECSAFAIAHFADGTLSQDEVITLAESWLGGEERPIEGLESWQSLAGSSRAGAQTVAESCAGLSLRPSLMHGDLAPWNVRIGEAGDPVLIDWEGGRENAIPGWDLLHYYFQKLVLVQKKSPEETSAEVRAFLKSPQVSSYLKSCGWWGHEKILFASYLVAMATENSHINPILERLLNSPD